MKCFAKSIPGNANRYPKNLEFMIKITIEKKIRKIFLNIKCKIKKSEVTFLLLVQKLLRCIELCGHIPGKLLPLNIISFSNPIRYAPQIHTLNPLMFLEEHSHYITPSYTR